MGVINIYNMNPVYLAESAVADVNLNPPGSSGRWQAVHNLHGTSLNVLAPSNEIYKYTAEDAASRSGFHAPLNSGKLDQNQYVLSSTTTTETSATGSFSGDTSGTVTVTRNGETVVGVTVPSFDGINYNGTALTAIVVTSTEGAGLEEGDVITFPCTSNTGLTVTITVAEDDLQLGAGLNILKVGTMAIAAVIPSGETVALPSFSKIQIQAADNGNDATAIAYYN